MLTCRCDGIGYFLICGAWVRIPLQGLIAVGSSAAERQRLRPLPNPLFLYEAAIVIPLR
jgi:hypothetical protein